MESYRFETFSRKPLLGRRQYYFRFVAPNGKTMFSSEGYNNRQDRDDAIDTIRHEVQSAYLQGYG